MMPLFVVITIVIITLCFWQWLLMYQRFHTTKHIELAAVNISQYISAHIETRILALTRMAQRWEVRSGTPWKEWEADATNYVRDYAGYHALAWVDNQYCVRWAVPNSDNQALENLNLLLEEHRSVYQASQQSQNALLTPTVSLPQEGKGFLIYVPLFLTELKAELKEQLSNNNLNYFDGFIVGFFHAQSLIDTIFNDKIKQEFAIEVFEENNKIYRSSDIDFENRIENQWSQETEINVGNVSWLVRVYPQPAYLKGEYSPLSNILGNGLITPILLKWAIYLMQSSHTYAKELERKNRALISEIVGRKKVESALRESEESFSKAFNCASIGMALVAPDGSWLQVNQALCEIVGYSEQELLTTTFQAITHPDDLQIDLNYVQKMLAGEISTYQMEKRYFHKRGNVVWILLSVSLVWDIDNQPLYFIAQIQDITERRKAEEELRNQNQALESAVVGISKLDACGNYLQVNPAYADLLGYQPEEIKGSQWQQTVHPEDREKASNAYEKMLALEKAEIEVRAIRKDGSVFDKILVMVKAYDSKQEFCGHYGFMKDISQRREIQRLKDEFISVVSHELRTPLTSIRGSLGLLAAGILQAKPQQAQRMLEIAVNNSDRLIRLINDILDIERIESRQVQMNKQICDAADLINSAVEVMRNMAQKAEVTIIVNPVSAPIWADSDRIIQVLTNLLSNAIKFSPPGSTVWLTAEIEENKNQIPHILFQIRDQGRGIPKDKLESIFGRFQQVDASDSRQKGGTGLGLAICRSIIQKHSGFIWAHSSKNQGSIFYFKMPLLQQKALIPAAIETTFSNSSSELINQINHNTSENQGTAQHKIKVLIVEDDTDLAQVIISIFQRHHIQTYHATTGREAIQQSLHLLPDLMVLDLALPEVNGFDVVDSLRHHKRLCNLPLVVYTALDLNDKDRKRLRLGETLLLTKARVTPEEFEQRAINLLKQFVLSDKGDYESEYQKNSNY
ncbi:MAG: PAS domain S-box protein [Cyanobacteria bacterium P01_A01_bin.80]